MLNAPAPQEDKPMARLGRYFLPDQPLHVIQRGNNRAAIFFSPADYGLYRRWLAEASATHGLRVHAYVLMTNHVHLLATPADRDSLPRTMQSLGRRYVRHVNASQRRTGTLWEGRYRAAPVDSEAYFLACCRYIELNPVRAGMVGHPRDYPWSSWHAHTRGAADDVVSEHPLYRALARTAAARQAAYHALFGARLGDDFLDRLRAATNGGWAFGDACFRRRIADAAGRRAAPLPRGRRAKDRDDGGQINLL
jgi:putative transposase